MLSNHLAKPSTSYSGRSNLQSNIELECLRDNNRKLREDLAKARQELSIAVEKENSLKAQYLNLHVNYCKLEKLVRANVYEFSNFLNNPTPQNPLDQTRGKSRNDSLFPEGLQAQKTVKTQLVRPTVKGYTIQVPRIQLNRLDFIEINSSTTGSDPEEGSGNTDVENHLSRLITANSAIPDNMENVRIVLERLPTNIPFRPLNEEQSNSNVTIPGESSSTSTDVSLDSQLPSTSLTNTVDSDTEIHQSVSDTQLNGSGCSSDSAISRSNSFSSLSQLAAMKMLGLELTTSSQKSSPSSVRSRLRRRRKTNQPTTPPQQKNRKRKLTQKCSGPSIRKNRISGEKIVMVLLDRKEMSKLLLRNHVMRIGRTLDNKTSSKAESRSTRRKNTAEGFSNQGSKATARSEVGSQTRKIKRKPKSRQSDVVSESFVKRNLSVKVTKLTAI